MKQEIIIPIIIIIICLILVYGIINYKFNKRIINTIESFQNTYELKNKYNLIQGIANNTEFTSEYANGNWTYLYTSVDSNYQASNLITISINQSQDQSQPSNNNFGTISIVNVNNIPQNKLLSNVLTFNITSFGNGMLTAISNENPIIQMFIQFLSVYGESNDLERNNITKQVYYTTETPMSIVSIYFVNKLINKYVSYKVYNNTV